MSAPAIYNITGLVRADSSCLLQFVGPANLPITWLIISGSGAITAIDTTGVLTTVHGLTDAYGRAFAEYSAGGYVGQVVIGVNYGS
jgi:hypothetical protein